MKKRFFAYSFVMTLMLLGAMYGHLHTGFSDMSTSDLIRILFGGGNDVEKLTVFDFRLVRTILAVLLVWALLCLVQFFKLYLGMNWLVQAC